MPAERAYLIVSHSAHLGKRTRTDRAVAARRPRPAPQGSVRPRSGHPPAERTTSPEGGLAALVGRTRNPGRHRLGTPGLRPYRPARRDAEAAGSRRSTAMMVPGRRPARHAARRSSAPRYAILVVLLATMVVSAWFSISGATAFAQMVRP